MRLTNFGLLVIADAEMDLQSSIRSFTSWLLTAWVLTAQVLPRMCAMSGKRLKWIAMPLL
jgi:hypothetical protein